MNNKKLVIGIITVFFIGVTGFVYSLGAAKDSDENVIITKGAIERENLTDDSQQLSNTKTNQTDTDDFIKSSNSEDESKEKAGDAKETRTGESTEIAFIYVHVCGEVKLPNVYPLEEGARVIDAVKKAGGFTKKAAKDYMNQARVVVDGEKLYIPTMEEVQDMNLLDGMIEQGSNLSIDSSNQNSSIAKTAFVNINTASMEELMTLPGIGESKANSIITYRKENGTFKSIEELKNIEGIKDGVFQKISDLITIE